MWFNVAGDTCVTVHDQNGCDVSSSSVLGSKTRVSDQKRSLQRRAPAGQRVQRGLDGRDGDALHFSHKKSSTVSWGVHQWWKDSKQKFCQHHQPQWWWRSRIRTGRHRSLKYCILTSALRRMNLSSGGLPCLFLHFDWSPAVVNGTDRTDLSTRSRWTPNCEVRDRIALRHRAGGCFRTLWPPSLWNVWNKQGCFHSFRQNWRIWGREPFYETWPRETVRTEGMLNGSTLPVLPGHLIQFHSFRKPRSYAEV